MSQQDTGLSLYDIYLEAAMRLFTNMQFLSSTVEDDIKANMERNPQFFGDRSKQYLMQMERDRAMQIVNLYREISKNNTNNIVQVILLYKPDGMTRTQFAQFVSSASALPLVKADTYNLTKWFDEGMPKGLYDIGENVQYFLKIEKFCVDNDIPYHVVENKQGEMKAMGIGPAVLENVNRIIGNLKRL